MEVELVSTSPHYGGLRWWFICPVTVGGRACQRRVRKLYLPPGGRSFACRRCCQLSYTSQRQDDNEPRAFEGASDPGAFGRQCLDGAAVSLQAQEDVVEDLSPVAGELGRVVDGMLAGGLGRHQIDRNKYLCHSIGMCSTPIYAAGPPQASLEEQDAGKPQQPPPPRDTAPAPERPRVQRAEWPLVR